MQTRAEPPDSPHPPRQPLATAQIRTEPPGGPQQPPTTAQIRTELPGDPQQPPATVRIRAELPGDHEAVLDVNRQAFGDAGGKVAALVQALRAAGSAGLSLVAEESGRVVGHLLVTRTLLDAPRRLVAVQVLSPLAVLPDRQRRGIGSTLIRHCADALDKRGVPLLWLEGDPAYYSRRGFTPGGDRGFRKPSLRIPDPAFQVMTFSAYQPWMTGTLVYSAPFWEHDCVGLRDPDA